MKIAQIAPLAERCPPLLYGGTERVVSYLTEELVAQGHDVTLFASGDSITAAELVPCCERALRLADPPVEALPFYAIMLEEIARRADEFDVLHFHIDLMHAPVVRAFAERTLTTLHGRLDLRELQPFYRAFPRLPLVSISHAQRRPMPPVNWAGTVHHGLPRDLLTFTPQPREGYLAFLGRISPEKRPDRAIEIAARTGMPLKIAAKIDRADKVYWDEKIGPLVRAHANVEYIGEITERQKSEFLGGAKALLFPIDWEEPFGLVVIEAMACGTPVVAFRRGSVPEILDHDVSGFVIDSIDEAVAAIMRLDSLDRETVRAQFEARFTVERMALDYVDIYRRLSAGASAAVLPQLVQPSQVSLAV
ncbi:MAG TPA: glycosyltransferase family 4 protein [Vitreimonas sp.]|uniref:glycosyltransferase family 4 protein n=1 Tax=Vitreimonas sp. TaxID=3069702 RepID=UPI002D24CC86|nr:glycosyltransferase family 4 protein [Vitreimonas sp.]HYD86343.1 glycosyltransferase family 4 protein [Vitreimonas sp.]